MPKGTLTVHIDRSPADVFAVVSDLPGSSAWVPDLVSVTQLGDGPVGVGTQYSEVVKMGDKEGEGHLVVTDFEPGRLFAHKGQGGPARFSCRFECHADGTGTRLVHHYTVSMGGMMKMMAPFLGSWVRKNSEAAMANLKRLLEEGEGASG
jgi:carbon monoxide dehydrogenase subunit G